MLKALGKEAAIDCTSVRVSLTQVFFSFFLSFQCMKLKLIKERKGNETTVTQRPLKEKIF